MSSNLSSISFSTTRVYTDFNPAHYPDPTTAGLSYEPDAGATPSSTLVQYLIAPAINDQLQWGVEAIVLVQPTTSGSADTVTLDAWVHDQATLANAAGSNPQDAWIQIASAVVVTAGQLPAVLKLVPKMNVYFRLTASSGTPKSWRVGWRSSNGSPFASAGAAIFGQLTTSSTAQLLVSSTTICSVGVTIYPDPSNDTYLSLSPITVGNGSTTFILRTGGAPLIISGPIDLHTIYVLDNGSPGTITFMGQ